MQPQFGNQQVDQGNPYGGWPEPSQGIQQNPYGMDPFANGVSDYAPTYTPNGEGQFPPQDAYDQFMNEPPTEPEYQENQGKKARKIKKKKPNRRRLNYRGWILAILILVLIGYGVYALFFQNGNKGGIAVIQYGKIGDQYSGRALIIRDETSYYEEGVQDIAFIAKEGSIVKRGDWICKIYSTGYSAKEVVALQSHRDQIKDYQRNLLSAETSYDQKMTRLEENVVDRGLEVRSLVHGARGDMIAQEELLSKAIKDRQDYFKTKYSSDTRMNRLYDDENTQLQRIDSWIKNKIATSEGVVSFYTDGFETVLTPSTYEQFSPSEVRSMLAGNIPGLTSAVKGRTPLYRMVTGNNYAVLLLMDEVQWNPEEGKTYKLVLERYNDLIADAKVLSFTRVGGELLVRLAVKGDIRDVLYMRSCSAQLGEYADSLLVPEGALYQQGGKDGIVVLENGKSLFVPIQINGKKDGYVYLSAEVTGSLREGQSVRLFK